MTISIQFEGISAFDVSPGMIDTAKTSGWYDESILVEIKDKTGKDETGYCFANDEMKVDDLFGKRLNRLKEFIVSKDPVIQITISNAQVDAVDQCFQHDSELDIDFFGFGISSSQHHYSVESCDIDTKSNTATITLSGPEPSSGATEADEVCYVLGGVVSYPPEAANSTALKTQAESPCFTCTLHKEEIRDLVRSHLPGMIRLVDVKNTDFVGNDYYIIFSCDFPYPFTEIEMKTWIERALKDKGNFHFD